MYIFKNTILESYIFDSSISDDNLIYYTENTSTNFIIFYNILLFTPLMVLYINMQIIYLKYS